MGGGAAHHQAQPARFFQSPRQHIRRPAHYFRWLHKKWGGQCPFARFLRPSALAGDNPEAESARQDVGSTSTVYRFGPFELDSGNRRLRRGLETVAMPDRHVELLILLAANAGQVVSKDVMIKTGWQDVAVTDSSIVHAVGGLRKALGTQADGVPYIETFRAGATASWRLSRTQGRGSRPWHSTRCLRRIGPSSMDARRSNGSTARPSFVPVRHSRGGLPRHPRRGRRGGPQGDGRQPDSQRAHRAGRRRRRRARAGAPVRADRGGIRELGDPFKDARHARRTAGGPDRRSRTGSR